VNNSIPNIPLKDLPAYNIWSQKILDKLFKADTEEEMNEIKESMFNQHPEWIEAFEYDYKHTVEFFD